MLQIKIGQVVESKAGRDKGESFIVVDIEGDFVYLADGRLRKIDKPKKKKIKHILVRNYWVSEFYNKKIESNIKISNSDIRKIIDTYCYETKQTESL